MSATHQVGVGQAARPTDEEDNALAALRKYFVFRSEGNYRAMMKAAKRFIRADHRAKDLILADMEPEGEA